MPQKSIAGIDVEEDAVNLYYFLKAKSTVPEIPHSPASMPYQLLPAVTIAGVREPEAI